MSVLLPTQHYTMLYLTKYFSKQQYLWILAINPIGVYWPPHGKVKEEGGKDEWGEGEGGGGG